MNSYDKVDVEDLRTLVFQPGSTTPTTYGVNIFSRRLVYKIAHEIMHGASLTQCQYLYMSRRSAALSIFH